MLGLTAASRENRLDLAATLEHGAPVFVHDGPIHGYNGYEQFGMILVRDGMSEHDVDRLILPHETVHLLKEDAWNLLVALPIERALLSRIPYGDVVLRYVDPGTLMGGSWELGSALVHYDRRPWEVEAYLLTDGRAWRDQFRQGR